MQCGGKGGCVGSIPQLAFNYVQLFGLTTAAEYPYWSGVTTITGCLKGVRVSINRDKLNSHVYWDTLYHGSNKAKI